MGSDSLLWGERVLPVLVKGPGGGGYKSRLLTGLGGGEGGTPVPSPSCPSAAPAGLPVRLRLQGGDHELQNSRMAKLEGVCQRAGSPVTVLLKLASGAPSFTSDFTGTASSCLQASWCP